MMPLSEQERRTRIRDKEFLEQWFQSKDLSVSFTKDRFTVRKKVFPENNLFSKVLSFSSLFRTEYLDKLPIIAEMSFIAQADGTLKKEENSEAYRIFPHFGLTLEYFYKGNPNQDEGSVSFRKDGKFIKIFCRNGKLMVKR